MKKHSSKIRDEIAKLQEQLKTAETLEAKRIGRIALKAGLGEIEVDENELQAAFEHLAERFRRGEVVPTEEKGANEHSRKGAHAIPVASGTAAGGDSEA
ncbi:MULTISPECIES: conjugal transfer protein TraC [Rhizobium]|uniref:N-acetylglutamate synthase/N-acetylornithine aminotransferase n=1 Tax=Rhizobium esperanzae TaxID=1967781 RepID=A0A7W6XY02_9HYPH|nr:MULTISPECIES: conjugal transfer protein TraC [Rhizobium]MBB4440229.1 N-acetylglutamate synthase/N-acetylornithine aminotransferase [Rhizobium esperanzae]MDH6202562.1 nitroimidazol reductase NimA-like FMN-containing flavoprotein (pyridoxamine 5'-phosphate oxidase superfamily) [Rhizobium leguminosarum]OAV54263.1 conjugal transfer protein TraC [Rhizobium sp. WYCCWR10014]